MNFYPYDEEQCLTHIGAKCLRGILIICVYHRDFVKGQSEGDCGNAVLHSSRLVCCCISCNISCIIEILSKGKAKAIVEMLCYTVLDSCAAVFPAIFRVSSRSCQRAKRRRLWKCCVT